MKTIFNIFDKRTAGLIFIISCLLVVLIFLFDHLMLAPLPIGSLFALPIVLASWYGTLRLGLALSILILIAWISYKLLYGSKSEELSVLLYNGAVLLISNAFLSIVISNFKHVYQFEEAAADTDKLTGLYNLRGFYEQLASESIRAKRYEHKFTIVYLDIDNFKEINDSLGHCVGDKLLIEVASCLKLSMRESDVVARVGGDEFVFLLPETDSSSAKKIISKTRKHLAEVMNGNCWKVGFSMGAVSFDEVPEKIEQIIKVADELMYTIKKGSKNDIAYVVWSNGD